MTVALEDLVAAAAATVDVGIWWRVRLAAGTEAVGPVLTSGREARLLDMTGRCVLPLEPGAIEQLEPATEDEARAALKRLQALEHVDSIRKRKQMSTRRRLPRGPFAGLSPRRQQLRADVLQLHAQGLTLIEIRRATGVAMSTAHGWITAA